MLPLVPCAMIPEKGVQKFHTDDASLPRTGKCFWLVMLHRKFAPTNQKHYPDLGSDASSIWNFCTCFLDVISQGNQGRHREMLVIFSGYMLLWIWNLGSNLFKVLTFQDAMYCSVVNTNFENKNKNKTKTVVSLATFVALQVWYGIPNERVPKSPLNSG